MTTSFYTAVADAVSRGAVSLRFSEKLQPTAGQGHPFQPPTYASDNGSAKSYALWESGVIDDDGKPVFSNGQRQTTVNVTVDSEGSQANRAEDGLSSLIGMGALDIPVLSLTINDGVTAPVTAFPGEREFTNLSTPHRQLDPIFRFGLVSRAEYTAAHPDHDISGLADVEDGLVPFARTPLGQALITAPASDLSAVLTYAPTSLLFGFWGSYSNGQSAERPRLARRYSSTIIARDAFPVTAGSTKMSQFNEAAEIKLAEAKHDSLLFEVSKSGKGKPSNVGAGSIISAVSQHGFTAQRIDWTTTISIRGLLQTPLGRATTFAQREAVATALLVLGIAGRSHADLFLRSGCARARAPAEGFLGVGRGADGRTESFAFDASAKAIDASFNDAKSALVASGGPTIGSRTDSIRLHLSPGYRQLIDASNDVPSIFKDSE